VGIGTTEDKSFEWKKRGFQPRDLIFLAKMNVWKYVQVVSKTLLLIMT